MLDGERYQRRIENASREKVGSKKIFGRERGRNNMLETGKEACSNYINNISVATPANKIGIEGNVLKKITLRNGKLEVLG